MKKNSIGELKLSPIKEDGKFVFFNDFITINGKVSKGDRITLFIDHYELKNGKYYIDPSLSASAALIVRGQNQTHEGLTGHHTIDELYARVTELYKENFYFGHKV
jgi:hypothetical protein